MWSIYFNLLSEFIHDVLVVNYLDDFLVIGDSFDACQLAQYRVIELLRFLGLQISWGKGVSSVPYNHIFRH